MFFHHRTIHSLICATLILITIGSFVLAFQTSQKNRSLAQHIWHEFHMSLDGIHRMLSLTKTTSTPNVSLLVAAHEYGVIAQRLAHISESLLIEHGVDAFPLAGYVMSLTGGITGICAEARQHGYIDMEWASTIQRYVGELHRLTASHSFLSLNKEVIQRELYDLFHIRQSQLIMTSTVTKDTQRLCTTA